MIYYYLHFHLKILTYYNFLLNLIVHYIHYIKINLKNQSIFYFQFYKINNNVTRLIFSYMFSVFFQPFLKKYFLYNSTIYYI